jgi:hypothetical protein
MHDRIRGSGLVDQIRCGIVKSGGHQMKHTQNRRAFIPEAAAVPSQRFSNRLRQDRARCSIAKISIAPVANLLPENERFWRSLLKLSCEGAVSISFSFISRHNTQPSDSTDQILQQERVHLLGQLYQSETHFSPLVWRRPLRGQPQLCDSSGINTCVWFFLTG